MSWKAVFFTSQQFEYPWISSLGSIAEVVSLRLFRAIPCFRLHRCTPYAACICRRMIQVGICSSSYVPFITVDTKTVSTGMQSCCLLMSIEANRSKFQQIKNQQINNKLLVVIETQQLSVVTCETLSRQSKATARIQTAGLGLPFVSLCHG